MIRLGCYEFIVCKGNVFKRIRKTKTHACLRCRTIVSFCIAVSLLSILAFASQGSLTRQSGCGSATRASTVALTLHQLFHFRAGIQQARLYVFVFAAATRLSSSETLHATSLQCPRLRLASGSLTRQSGCGSAFRASTPPCHSRLRAGILGGLMRGIVLPLIASPVFHPRQHLPGFACAPIVPARRPA